MSDEIIKVIDELARRFGVTIDWTNKNVVPYLKDLMQRFVTYHFYKQIIFIIIGVILFLIFVGLAIKMYKDAKNSTSLCDEEACYGCFVFMVFLALCALGFTVSRTIEVVKCKTVPEMVVYEYIDNERSQ